MIDPITILEYGKRMHRDHEAHVQGKAPRQAIKRSLLPRKSLPGRLLAMTALPSWMKTRIRRHQRHPAEVHRCPCPS